MKRVLATFLAALTFTLALAGSADAQGKKKKKAAGKAKAEVTDLGADGKATVRDSSEGTKVKEIDFTGLALSGRIRTPQLLYFLNRIRQELEAVQLEKRSFMPELARSVNDDAL